MNKIYALIFTLIAGLFFLLGLIITKRVKDKKSLSYFAIALAFIVMLNLIIFDLAPEIIELFNITKFSYKIFIVLIIIVLGFLSLEVLDLFIPDHHHEHHEDEKNTKEHNSHVYHIGLITLISLILHNILEGIAIYGMAINNIKLGFLMCIGVALHNIPLGIEISLAMCALKRKRTNIVLFFLLTISSLLGGLIILLLGNVSNILLGVITSLTLGMLIYIAFKELLPEIISNYRQKGIYYGIIIGIVIIIFTLFI